MNRPPTSEERLATIERCKDVPSGCFPFNLRAALAGWPCVTREGETVEEVIMSKLASDHCKVISVVDQGTTIHNALGSAWPDLPDEPHTRNQDLFLKGTQMSAIELFLIGREIFGLLQKHFASIPSYEQSNVRTAMYRWENATKEQGVK